MKNAAGFSRHCSREVLSEEERIAFTRNSGRGPCVERCKHVVWRQVGRVLVVWQLAHQLDLTDHEVEESEHVG